MSVSEAIALIKEVENVPAKILEYIGMNIQKEVGTFLTSLMDQELTHIRKEHPETRERFGKGLVAWIAYQNIGLRQSQENVGKGLTDIF